MGPGQQDSSSCGPRALCHLLAFVTGAVPQAPKSPHVFMLALINATSTFLQKGVSQQGRELARLWWDEVGARFIDPFKNIIFREDFPSQGFPELTSQWMQSWARLDATMWDDTMRTKWESDFEHFRVGQCYKSLNIDVGLLVVDLLRVHHFGPRAMVLGPNKIRRS